MQRTHIPQLCTALFAVLFFLSACGPIVNQMQSLQVVNVNQQFQHQLTPIPTIPAYRCGAWASTNVPATNSLIAIYARLTQGSIRGFAGITAQAVVHLKGGDMPMNGQAVSDTNGNVAFDFPLAGRQPRLIPATVDVTFNTPGGSTSCTAFFTVTS